MPIAITALYSFGMLAITVVVMGINVTIHRFSAARGSL